MVSGDTIDRMVDWANDLLEVQQNPTEQATELALSSVQEVAGEIAPEQDFKDAFYGSDLGVRTLPQYYSTYFIPKGIIFTAPGDSRAFKAPINSIVLYEQTLVAGFRFPIPLFFKELLLCLGLALGQLMPNV